MKASRLIKRLTNLINQYGDLPLIYAADNEGNYYEEVYYDATPCEFTENDYITVEPDKTPTHICIN